MVSLDTRIELPMFGDTIAIPTLFIIQKRTSYEIDSKTGLYKKDKKGNYITDYYRDENGEILTVPEYKRDKKGNSILDKDGFVIPTGKRVIHARHKDIWEILNVGNQTINKTRQISSRKGQHFLNLGVGEVNKVKAVSYTHLTLPTIYSV